ncbi:MAG TPA: DUF3179 domain-containing (seleno)protein [Actinomycetota bacterium]|nr:DUF3179 domain-containing (seleno)protein [Actinomycetota bacterium]
MDVLSPGDIPPLTQPSFASLGSAADWLGLDAPVIVVRDGASARAYPLAILLQHEVVDDVVGGVPVAVTYSPLANAAIVFDRRVRLLTLTFATSGKVYLSDLVMYDRETKSLWPQILGASSAGELKGEVLKVVPSQLSSFGDFVRAYPSGQVLVRPGSATYASTPYPAYDSRSAPYEGFFGGRLDTRLPAMARVVGVVDGGVARGYPYASLAISGNPVIVTGRDYVVFWGGGARSPLSSPTIAEGRVVGSSGVFRPRARGRALQFVVVGDEIHDRETGSTWSLDGVAIGGPLKGAELAEVPHLDAFWFAWAAFHSETSIWS